MKFSIKKFTSLSLGFSFLIMTYTGVMLYFVPKGKVAYWADWHLLGLSKSQYGDIHTTSMVSFLIFGILHIYYNWKPLISYMKDKTKQVSFTKSEFLAALSLNLLFIVGTLYMLQPFKAYLDLEENIKEYWAQEYGEPPYGHAEESTLGTFCKKTGLDYQKSLELLKLQNIVFQKNEKLIDIAKKNDVSPKYLYTIISVSTLTPPSHLGRRTLKELVDMNLVNLQEARDILKEKGLFSVEEDDTLKSIANKLEMMPIDLYKLIKKRS